MQLQQHLPHRLDFAAALNMTAAAAVALSFAAAAVALNFAAAAVALKFAAAAVALNFVDVAVALNSAACYSLKESAQDVVRRLSPHL